MTSPSRLIEGQSRTLSWVHQELTGPVLELKTAPGSPASRPEMLGRLCTAVIQGIDLNAEFLYKEEDGLVGRISLGLEEDDEMQSRQRALTRSQLSEAVEEALRAPCELKSVPCVFQSLFVVESFRPLATGATHAGSLYEMTISSVCMAGLPSHITWILTENKFVVRAAYISCCDGRMGLRFIAEATEAKAEDSLRAKLEICLNWQDAKTPLFQDRLVNMPHCWMDAEKDSMQVLRVTPSFSGRMDGEPSFSGDSAAARGGQYRGGVDEDGCLHGLGLLLLGNGDAYCGQWHHGQRQGFGVAHRCGNFLECSQNVYIGQWDSGKPHGVGVKEDGLDLFCGRFQHGFQCFRGVSFGPGVTCQALRGAQMEPLAEALQKEMDRASSDITPLGGEEGQKLFLKSISVSRNELRSDSSDDTSTGSTATGGSSTSSPSVQDEDEALRNEALALNIERPFSWTAEQFAAFCRCLGLQLAASYAESGEWTVQGIARSPASVNDGIEGLEGWVLQKAIWRLLESGRRPCPERQPSSTAHPEAKGLEQETALLQLRAKDDGKLQLRGFLGKGGYGKVYAAMIQQKLLDDKRVLISGNMRTGFMPAPIPGSYVAAKSIQGSAVTAKRELQREMVVFAGFRHPNVLKLIGLSTCKWQREYILTELHEGSLFEVIHDPDRLGAPQRLSNCRIVELGRGIAGALMYMHSLYIAHVDVKSANVLLDLPSSNAPAVPKICDFGHAQMMPRSGASRMIRRYGTPNYAAPECLRCESITTAVDIWSFGMLLYEMQSRQVPNYGLSQGQIATAVGWAGVIPDLDALSFEELARLAKTCLQGCPSMRPNAKKLQKDLKALETTARRQTWKMLSEFFG